MGNFLQFGQPLPRRVCFLIEFVQCLPVPQSTSTNLKIFIITINGNTSVWIVILYFYNIGTCLFHCLDGTDSNIKALQMITRQFCQNQRSVQFIKIDFYHIYIYANILYLEFDEFSFRVSKILQVSTFHTGAKLRRDMGQWFA